MRRTLRVAADSAPQIFDMEQPAGFTNSLAADVFCSMYDQLTAARSLVDANGARSISWQPPEGVLAEAWRFSDDGRTCTFRLREGVRSAAGSTLDAAMVQWGWERAFAMRDIGKWVARISSVQEPTDIEVVDSRTIAFRLAAPNPALPRTMAQCTPSVYDTEAIPQDPADPWARGFLAANAAGFGPYTLAAHGADATVLRAHAGYWRGAPPVRNLGSTEAGVEALAAGEVDLVVGVSLQDAARVRMLPHVRLASVHASPGLLVHVDVDSAPFGDPLVRQALACAIPYADVIQTAYLGAATRWRSYVQPQAPGYRDLWPYEEDRERAAALLARSTHAGGFATEMAVGPGEELRVAAEILRDAWASIGIEVRLAFGRARSDEEALNGRANLGPLMLRGAGPGGRGNRVHDPLYAMYHDHGPGRMRLFNYSYDNPVFFDALRAIPSAGPEWEAAAHHAQDLLNADAVAIPICWYPTYVAHHKDLLGYVWQPDNRYPFAALRWR
jgi:peptide/nickel transport system substrate-binding protein